MIQNIKNIIKNNPMLYDHAQKCIRIMTRQNPEYKFLNMLSKIYKKNIKFIQIGANDGLRNDPIREFVIRDKWEGIFIEPHPQVFQLLKANYKYLNRSNLIFLNTAISPFIDELIFWTYSDMYLNELSYEEQLDVLRKSSFDKGHLLNFIDPEKKDLYLKGILVNCIDINEVFKRYDIIDIDLLLMDTEGHELSIIKSINFNLVSPRVIYFESRHLGEKKDELYEFLRMNGYFVLEFGVDCAAIKYNSRIHKYLESESHIPIPSY